ncbi:hypothetical protein EUA81_00385 [TM7 phylum sp. oral taxon 356]|nr:hypothetical protein EUA81_00385 [TM7 phylum sp. oral taxon 356]
MLDRLGRKFVHFWTVSRLVLMVVIAAVAVWMAMVIQVLNNNYKLQRQVDNAKLDSQMLELENQNLRLEQLYYRTDEYMELSARSLLGKALPGEHLVVLPRISHASKAKRSGSAVVTKSNFDQWLDFLFGQNR